MQSVLITANFLLIGRQNMWYALQDRPVVIGAISLIGHGKPGLRVRFPLSQCRSYPLHDQCTPVAAKVLILRPDEASYNALQEARKRQETKAFRTLYATRAGIEGTVARVSAHL